MNELLSIAPTLRAADGWLALGLPQEAWEETERLPAALKVDPVVALLRVSAVLMMEKGERPLDQEIPDLASVHLLAARAYSRIGKPKRALRHLALALKLRPELSRELALQRLATS